LLKISTPVRQNTDLLDFEFGGSRQFLGLDSFFFFFFLTIDEMGMAEITR
jgi:hypothetical protein